jgi:MFS family permease
MLGSAILGLCVAAYALVQSWLGFLLAIIGVAVSFYVWRVAFKTALYDATIAKVRGEQIGFYKTCTGIGDMLGPLLGGILIDMVSLPAAFIAGAATSIAASAIMKTATR